MKLIKEKYTKIHAAITYLTDELLIAQAWKKTHKYMRSHNWYADTLALDVSALGLERDAKVWANAVKKPEFKLKSMQLVPAAKSETWAICPDKGWGPQKDEETRAGKPPLRPLAHLSIRDQTLATTVMLCLADAIETAQGDCGETNFELAQKKSVYSYGNRLICDWNASGEAWFRWGNSETYRKFFTDYQNFLQRPVDIGRGIAQGQSDADDIYIISLDLEKFYDRVDTTVLLDRLKKLSIKFGRAETCSQFWAAAARVIDWHWDKEARKQEEKLKITLGNGLPQGLVAAGFFANAYMVDFDLAIGSRIGKSLPSHSGIVLHDYCRYVDDARLVVRIESPNVEDALRAITNWFSKELKNYAGPTLSLNSKKAKISALADLDNKGSLSGRIDLLHQELSGPADRELLESSSAVLEGLLTIQTDEIADKNDIRSKDDRALIRLTQFDHDIRPDTLKRFAANRLESISRAKRKLSVVENQEIDDNESELLSKKLIKAWMLDPSLGLVLRKALEIFPSPIIAEPVFEAIFKRSSLGNKKGSTSTQAMMDYLLADLFRNCVDFNGFFQTIDLPKSSSPEGVFDIACNYALKVISGKAPTFLVRQALLLLATFQKPVLVNDPEESIQHSLHSIMVGRLPIYRRQRLALFEVAAQITGRFDSFASLVLEYIAKTDSKQQYDALEELAKRGGEFWFAIWRRLQKTEEKKELLSQLKWASSTTSGQLKRGKQRLSKIVASKQNGFEHEAALIKLALGLITLATENANIVKPPRSPKELDIACSPVSSWTRIWNPRVTKIVCSDSRKTESVPDPRFAIPPWINQNNSDNAVMYWIGSILRAAAVGGNDFTGNRWRTGSVKGYKGLRTGWYKRRMGMMHSAETLVGEYATVSDWFAELLMTCLQWPGVEATYVQESDIADIQCILSLKAVLERRLTMLNGLCCSISDMPTMLTVVKRPTSQKKNGFRIVTIQQLLPKTSDFSLVDPTLSNSRVRSKVRDHLSRIALLTYRTLVAKLKADSDDSKVGADLIVFPEVAVHPDDQDILKRLADKTKAIVFAGLVFVDHDGALVNIGRWFIPDYRESGRRWIIRDQGKAHMTTVETKLGITGSRPCQHIIELVGDEDGPFRLSGAICYDATDLKLATDLMGKTDMFVVCAHNKDVGTFDTMAAALNYHMYQHVVLVNKGEFGGTTIQAPYRANFDRMISHAHGVDQISINVADLDLAAFRRSHKEYKQVKTKPAGL
ncbi:MAG: hypothetical protein K2Y13_05515 [Burkholderiaceae bacterium]|nr:hypothetical protein [Burkholderiaceae bacterium]